MITTMDVGEKDDIHPRNKQAIGYRFAQWALGNVYHQKVPAITGPLPDKFDYGFKKVIISFKHAEGLKTTDGGKPKNFFIAAKDGPYLPAEAVIFEDKIIVSHPDVWWPAGVRYAWGEAPEVNLVNGANLPASPFRTDGGN
jgi:sialate O-acetylesterase